MSRKIRVAQLPQPVPPRETQQLAADIKRRLRQRPDLVGLAVVYVFRDGSVSTSFAGHQSGAYHQLSSGAHWLAKRIMNAGAD
jgi:hypothetical protein